MIMGKNKKIKNDEPDCTEDNDLKVKVYVGNINKEAKDNDLRTFLGVDDFQIGVQTNGKPMGFGFAFVHGNRKDAVLKKNGLEFLGQQLVIEIAKKQDLSQPKKHVKRGYKELIKESRKAKYLVQNINKSATMEEIVQFLKCASLHLKDDEDGYFDGSAIAIVNAIDKHRLSKMHGAEFKGNKLSVTLIVEKSSNVYIKGLSKKTTEDSLKKVFTHAENIVVYCKKTGESFCKALMEFKNASIAKDMLDRYNGETIDGSVVSLELAPPSHPPSSTLVVSNLSPSTTIDHLYEYFDCVSASIPINPTTNQPYSYAYVEYLKVGTAAKKKGTLNNTTLNGQKVKVNFFNYDKLEGTLKEGRIRKSNPHKRRKTDSI